MEEQELLIGMDLSPLLKTLLNLNFPYSEVLREETPRGVMKIKLLLRREALFLDIFSMQYSGSWLFIGSHGL